MQLQILLQSSQILFCFKVPLTFLCFVSSLCSVWKLGDQATETCSGGTGLAVQNSEIETTITDISVWYINYLVIFCFAKVPFV